MDTATRIRQQYIAETDRLKNEIKMLDLGQGGHRTSATRRNTRTTRLLPFSSRPVISTALSCRSSRTSWPRTRSCIDQTFTSTREWPVANQVRQIYHHITANLNRDCSRFAPHNRPTPYKQRLRKFRITSFIRQSHHSASWPPSPDRERCSDLSVHILTQYTTHSHHCQQATALPAAVQLIRPPVSQNHSDVVDWWLICSTNAVR